MFDWIPMLKGRYFTAEQYLQIMVLLTFLILGFIFYLLKSQLIVKQLINLSVLSFSWFGNNKFISLLVLVSLNYKSLKTLIILLLLYLFTFDICFAMHNIEQGFFLTFDGAAFSSAFTRLFAWQDKYHVYVTLTENEHQIIFNFQIGRLRNYSLFCNQQHQTLIYTSLYDRYIYHSIINLTEQNNTLELYLDDELIDQFQYVDFNQESLTIVDGGDSGYTETSKRIWNIISTQGNIDLINIGGDVAYDNGFLSCISCWDKFLTLYSGVCRQKNKLIPLVLSIGNHDVGRVTNPDLLFDTQQNEKLPYIIQMFPQHLTNYKIPNLNQRLSYFHHPVGPINFITLDSGYLSSSKEQIAFLENSLSKIKPNLVSYHVPVIPLLKDDEQFLIDLGYYLNQAVLVFEHHKHNFKRSQKIQVYNDNNTLKVFPGDTIYVGNGAMGIQSAKDVQHHIIQKTSRKAHFWLYRFENNKQFLRAFDDTGSMIDYIEIF